jgi:hypothetical protein
MFLIVEETSATNHARELVETVDIYLTEDVKNGIVFDG